MPRGGQALAGSVQVVSSTNGDLGPSSDSPREPKMGGHLNTQPDVEVVEETKYVLVLNSILKKVQSQKGGSLLQACYLAVIKLMSGCVRIRCSGLTVTSAACCQQA